MLDPSSALHYRASSMNNRTEPTKSLGTAFQERIAQLGISRRELTKRTGLSRQTLHNIEHGGRTDLRPATFRALDKALLWQPGTAIALARGTMPTEEPDFILIVERENAYRWMIVEIIQRMSLADLERMVSIMEHHTNSLEANTPTEPPAAVAR